MARRWHEVTMDELRTLWEQLRKEGQWYNGCTHVALVERYGRDNLKHRAGKGWYKLVDKQTEVESELDKTQ